MSGGERRTPSSDDELDPRPLRSRVARLGLLVVIGGILSVTAISMAIAPAALIPGVSHPVYAELVPVNAPAHVASAPAPALTLGIQATPHTICAFGLNTCAAASGTARVTLTASAGSGAVLAWPAVQVAFVVETTSTDGVFDPTAGEPGLSSCAQAGGVLCEESNGVPFFVANAQQIANAISAANPHSQVSFAMVDYFANVNNWDDGDGAEYHVDIPQFIPSSYFGAEVVSNFQAKVLNGGWYYGDSDMADNQLTSSSITAMYGTIIGSGLDWSNNTHHVIVWMGSTAPRDPNYPIHGCVSYQNAYYCQDFGDLEATCEPSYTFSSGTSPNCEGWVKSQDGNATHSIAALAHTAPSCTDSIGGVCTVDTIDYWDSATDPLSKDWPTGTGQTGGGPGGSVVQQDVQHILLAGCDMAQATGGTWDGPAWYACPNGQAGTLQYVPHGPYNNPVTTNPTLFNALRQIGFGPILQTQVASGTGKPIFQFVPFGNIAIDTGNLQPTAACIRDGVSLRTCQTEPSIIHYDGVTYLGWNWSRNASTNVMYVGDAWTASFNVLATGPPYTTVPVDACTTVECRAGGSTSVDGLFASATYVPYTNNTILTQSFPLGQVAVEVTPPTSPPPNVPPPPPPVPPPFAIPTAPPVPVVQQIGVGNSVGVANLSIQATAAGFLGAGFMRVGMKNRPVAMKIAAKSGPHSSKFDLEASKKDTGIGRFE